MTESSNAEIKENQSKADIQPVFDRYIQKKERFYRITQISVSGYKSIYEECSIDLLPLTILAGANSSGKSSIMQPLLLLKQTLEATYDPGALLLNGPNVRFTFAKQFLSQIPKNDFSNEFSIKIKIEGKKSLSLTFQKQQNQQIEVSSMTCRNGEKTFTASLTMTRQEVISELSKWYKDKNGLNITSIEEDKFFWEIVRERCFISIKSEAMLHTNLGIIKAIVYDSHNHTNLFESDIRNLIHIPALRGNPERTYNTTPVGKEFPGTFESYVASIISYWQKSDSDRLIKLANALQKLGLAGKVDTRQINDVQIELRVSRLPLSNQSEIEDMVNIADVGFGVSQTLPVLVALLVAEPGQLVYLEQPEIHLHPRAQVALAEILTYAANRGVRVVLETHSELLLLAVQSLVAEGKLSPELVKLHWFKRREDGVTEVSSTDLDAAGAFGDWPEDFSDVSLKLESRYLDAAEARLMNN
ncbi:MAG: AAA family ATPase [Phormidium sp.]